MKWLHCTSLGLLLFAAILVAGHFSVPGLSLSEPTQGDPPAAPLAVCFAEGTSDDYMAEWSRRLIDRHGGDALDYNLGQRWSSTANGGTGSTGDGITLTYSFVPDGTSIEGDPSVLFSMLNAEFGTQEAWQNQFASMFASWGALTGNTYVQVSDDGAAWGQGSPGVIGARGDVRIASTVMDGSSGVLAYNFFPNRGEMVLDADENWGSAANNYRFIRNIIAHEHGHGLGFFHVCPINTTKLMEPTYTSNFDGPQHDDILAGQRYYGDTYEPNDALNMAYGLGNLAGTTVIENASLDDDSDQDMYSFTMSGSQALTITLDPVGFTYLEGDQNGDGSCQAGVDFSTDAVQNLNLRLYDSQQIVVASSQTHQAGESEQVFRYQVTEPNQSSFYVEVDGASANSIQLYRLTIELVNPATPYLTGCPVEFDTTLQGVPVSRQVRVWNPELGGELSIDSIGISGPFSVTPNSGIMLEPAGFVDLTVTFDAVNLGNQGGTLTVSHNGPGGDLVCEISALAVTSSLDIFTGAVTNFGEVPVGVLDSALVGLRAQGNIPLIITSVSTTAPFGINFSGPLELQPGPLFRLYPRVTPAQFGEVRGWFVIHHSAPTSPDSVELVVNGTSDIGPEGPMYLPDEFALLQNYPNPFNPTTRIVFDVPQSSPVRVAVYNLQGRLVKELVSGVVLARGRHEVSFDGGDLSSGMYIYDVQAGNNRAQRKMLLVK